MPINRYKNPNTKVVRNDAAKDVGPAGNPMALNIAKRQREFIDQYTKQDINEITEIDRASFDNEKYIFKLGDRLFKIAFDAYGDTRYWYLIAWWNQKPADFCCKPGDIIYIPRPLKDVLQLWNKEK